MFSMKTTILVVIIMMVHRGEAKEDMETMFNKLQMQINAGFERCALTEEKLMKELKQTQGELLELKAENVHLKDDLSNTKDELATTKDVLAITKDDLATTKDDLATTKDVLAITKDDLATTKDDLATTKDDLATTKDDLATTKDVLATAKDLIDTENVQLRERMKMTEEVMTNTKEDLLETKMDVSFLKEPPFLHACGYLHDTYITRQTIPYSSLLYSSTNTEGVLDITSGTFTCDHPGSYTATWSLMAEDHAEDHVVLIYLRKNGASIEESQHLSQYSDSSGLVDDQGGRTLVLHLDRGDTLDLYCQDCSAGIAYTTFCVSLSTFDII